MRLRRHFTGFTLVELPAVSNGKRAAFTLVELLVVIGIIAVLISILIPVLATARRAARNTACASNLHQLTAACTMYQNEHRKLPAPLYNPAFMVVYPGNIQQRLLNDLAPYLAYTDVPATARVADLPPVVTCPARMEVEIYQDPINAGVVFWFTGFNYFGRLDEQPNPMGEALRADRIADARGRKRAVLFADSADWANSLGAPGWLYFHLRNGAKNGGAGAIDTSDLHGQHRAWTDGSVEWINGSDIDPNPARFPQTASYRVGTPGNSWSYYWF